MATAADTFAPLIKDVAIALLGKPDKSIGDGKVLRWGSRGSFKIDVPDGVWHDKEANAGGGVLDLVMRERRCDKAGALQWLEAEGLIEPRESRSADVPRYPYRDAAGRIAYAKARVDRPNQKYQLQHFDGQRWKPGRNGAPAIPYRLPELLAAPDDAVLYMAEGEKHADKLASWGFLATSHKDWHRNFAQHVRRRVVILPDNDEPGENQAADAARLIREAGGDPVIVRLPGLPEAGDIMDWTGTAEDLRALVAKAMADYTSQPPKGGLAFRNGISARALMAKHFDPIRWIIPGYLPEGMYVLAGAPKLGKSWLALDWQVAVGSGGTAMGSIECEQGDVLGLMLEDNQRRLQRRLRQMRLIGLPERLTLLTEWPTLDDGCIEEIERWIAAVEKPRLIVVDVFARVKGTKTGKETDYDFDYRQAAALQAIASRHNLAVVVVHHTRKMAADDPFDEVSGTRGLTGAADGVLVLKRSSDGQQVVIYGRGRDLEEVETALQFDKETGRWNILGAAWLVADTTERREIQQVLGRSVDPMSPTEIGERIGKSRANVAKMLAHMAEDGQVQRVSRGRYVLVTMVTPDTENITNVTNVTDTYVREDKPDFLAPWGTKAERGE
jgi:biotin operon repressor